MLQYFKNKLVKLGLVIFASLIFVPALAYADTIDLQGAACSGSDIKITSDPGNHACDAVNKDNGSTANKIVSDVINLLTVVVGVLAVIMIIYAGFRYVSSGGSDEAVKGAKSTITYAIIGLVIVALAQIIVHFVISKTTTATTPQCIASGKTHKWDSGPDAGHSCTP